ncbi:MAG: hypothetical protein ACYSUI_06000 [Planctomycetota bacterium]
MRADVDNLRIGSLIACLAFADADIDGDGDVDLDYFALLMQQFTGPF